MTAAEAVASIAAWEATAFAVTVAVRACSAWAAAFSAACRDACAATVLELAAAALPDAAEALAAACVSDRRAA